MYHCIVWKHTPHLADIYLLNVNNWNTWTRCKICLKKKTKNKVRAINVVLVSLLLTLNIWSWSKICDILRITKKRCFKENLNISATNDVSRSQFQHVVHLCKSIWHINFQKLCCKYGYHWKICRFTLRGLYDISI